MHGAAHQHLGQRRVGGHLPNNNSTTWTPGQPEFCAVANGLSLLMPSLEPYVLKAVRRGAQTGGISDELCQAANEFVAQELAHHQEHRAFNNELIAQVPFLRRIESLERRVIRTMDKRLSLQTSLAYAAGAEAVAFFTACWVDRRRHQLLATAHGDAAKLFVWHLAEEVEHKNVAFDVYRANGGGRGRYFAGILCALSIMALSIMIASAVLLIGEKRWWHPRTHLRMIGYSLSFVFEVFPMLGLCLTKDHHPSNWTNPEWLGQWLDEYDANGAPAWTQETLDGIFDPQVLRALGSVSHDPLQAQELLA